jgi:hypothetical protein
MAVVALRRALMLGEADAYFHYDGPFKYSHMRTHARTQARAQL